MTHPSELHVQRYGATGPRGRALVVTLSVVVGAALLGWAIWAAASSSDPALDASVSSYDVVSMHETRVQVHAHFRDAGTDGTCLVRATAADHTVVGELNLTAAQLRDAGSSWISIRTEREATTAEIVRCDTTH